MDVPIGKPFIILDQSEIPTDTTFADAWDVDLSSPDGVGKGYDAWLQERVAEADPNVHSTPHGQLKPLADASSVDTNF